jgi:hypothetical protein
VNYGRELFIRIFIHYRTKYGLYQDAASLCRNEASEENWKRAVYWVFDAPNLVNQSFEVILLCIIKASKYIVG